MPKLIGFFLVGGAMLLWIVGATAVIALHYKRRGIAITSGLQPLQLNLRDGLKLAAVGAGALVLGAVGISLLNG